MGDLVEPVAGSYTFTTSTKEVTAAVLRLVAEQLGTRTSFLCHVSREDGQLQVLAAHNAVGGCDVIPGTDFPLLQTF